MALFVLVFVFLLICSSFCVVWSLVFGCICGFAGSDLLLYLFVVVFKRLVVSRLMSMVFACLFLSIGFSRDFVLC